LRRDSGDRLAGGVASGLARWRGFNPTNVRIILVIAALFSQGWLVPFYFIAWLLIPAGDAVPAEPENRAVPGGAPPGDNNGNATSSANAVGSANAVVPGSTANIWSRARHDSRGITLAAGVVSVICVFLLEAGVLNDQVIQDDGWPQVVSAACLVLIWRNASDAEQASLRRLVAPLGGLGPDAERRGRGTMLRLALACVMVAVGMGWLLSTHNSLALLRPLSGFVLILGGLVLLLGPWWLRIARDLVLERQARARAEERADMAARVHDSVLQTLALIQRRADDPAQVTQLARAQERELRSWLFEGRAPGSMHEVTSLAAGVRQIQQEAEARHGVPVEVVTVGDCPLDDDLAALLEAAREAVVNAAKWSQASVISLYAEVTAEDVELVVRDRGRGFDPAAVPGDRKGMAESIHGRMGRHGGTVTVQTAIGEGTKVSLKMPRSAVRASS
jgi:signal transduction histidine kinase/phage shock protein PspC (stress-responsive transcriptional regulator)